MREVFIYFMRPVGCAGPVKIGYSLCPERRLREVTWNGQPVELAALYEGVCSDEGRFHALLRDSHLTGEWFELTPQLSAVIDAIRGGTFDPSILPEHGKRVPIKERDHRWTPEHRENFRIGMAARAAWLKEAARREYRLKRKQARSGVSA